MSPLGTWITSHKGDSVRSTFWLVKLGLATPVYLTDCDQPVVYDGHTFVPAPLTVEGIQGDATSASGNGGRLELATGEPYWPSMVGEIATGSRNFEVTFWEMWLDTSTLPSAVPAAVRLVAVTKVEAAEWDSWNISFTLGPSADPALGRLPFREYSSSCTYRKFKGPQCGYSGSETTCDRTSAACAARSNTARFGGFTSLNAKDEDTATWAWNDGVNDYTGSVTFRLRGE